MDFSIKKEQQAILDTAGQLAREELLPRASDIDVLFNIKSDCPTFIALKDKLTIAPKPVGITSALKE